jgi:hypothetical protein
VRADPRFLRQGKSFWANVRTITEKVGYTERRTGQVKVPTLAETSRALLASGLTSHHIVHEHNDTTPLGALLLDYFKFRADILNSYARPRLMDVVRAQAEFDRLRVAFPAERKFTMNKQSDEKKRESYFTGIISMLVEASIGDYQCNYDPQQLTSITRDGAPLRTLARRVDGAFPSTVDPIAIWEIKEYYYTTTFGSRVSGGVYETLLDGMEIEELRDSEKVEVLHYLMVDGYGTWWDKGRSYLCRMIDMLHMGYADEVLFGYEVVERLPEIAAGWVAIANSRGDARRKPPTLIK